MVSQRMSSIGGVNAAHCDRDLSLRVENGYQDIGVRVSAHSGGSESSPGQIDVHKGRLSRTN